MLRTVALEGLGVLTCFFFMLVVFGAWSLKRRGRKNENHGPVQG